VFAVLLGMVGAMVQGECGTGPKKIPHLLTSFLILLVLLHTSVLSFEPVSPITTSGLQGGAVAVFCGFIMMLLRAVFRTFEHCKHRKNVREGTMKKRVDESESDLILTRIDYDTLLLFLGQFILVGATNDTGYPKQVLTSMLSGCSGPQMFPSTPTICVLQTTFVTVSVEIYI
jgi:Na+/H+ antiporter NhaD/arsenite permease-like protein